MQTTDSSRQTLHGRTSSRMIRALAVLPLTILLLILALVALNPTPVSFLLLAAFAAVWVLWCSFIVRSGARAEDSLLQELGALEVDADAPSRMHNLVEGLCLTMGLNKPRMWTIPSHGALALVVSGPGSAGSLVFSEGLASSLDRVESEALAAHMLVRLRSGDAETISTALALWRASSRYGMGRIASLVLSRMAHVEPVHLVDAAACRITRYPPALISVLARFESGAVHLPSTGVPDRIRGSLGPLLVAEPGPGDAFRSPDLPSLEPVRLSIGERIDLLKEY